MTSGTASSSKCKGTTSQLATSWQVNTGGGKRFPTELHNQNNIVSKYFLLRGESALVGFSENSVSVKKLGLSHVDPREEEAGRGRGKSKMCFIV